MLHTYIRIFDVTDTVEIFFENIQTFVIPDIPVRSQTDSSSIQSEEGLQAEISHFYLTPFNSFPSAVSACASSFPVYTSDAGLSVANGTYAITANRCVQCSCGPGNLE